MLFVIATAVGVLFVFNHYIIFAAIQGFFHIQVFSYALVHDGGWDGCSRDGIGFAVSPQLCSSPSFSISINSPLNSISLRFNHVCAFVFITAASPYLSYTLSTVCASFHRFFHLCQLSFPLKGWHFSRLCFLQHALDCLQSIVLNLVFCRLCFLFFLIKLLEKKNLWSL